MTQNDDISMQDGKDAEDAMPIRAWIKARPLLVGAIFGFFALAILAVVSFSLVGTPEKEAPTPTVVDVATETNPDLGPVPTAGDIKPVQLSEDSAPSTVPVVAEAAVLITDVGLSRRVSEAIIRQLPTVATIAVSPYATNPSATIAAYKSAGNDVWLQMAARSTRAGIDPGPLAMSVALANNENQGYLNQQLAQAGGGFVGLYIPNDADITTSVDAWKAMALDLIGKNLMILDGTPVKVATELYVPQNESGISAYLKADITIPGDQGPAALKDGLAAALPIILREREAIVVISRPTTLAITTLAEWLKTLRPQGIVLVPASKFTGLKP